MAKAKRYRVRYDFHLNLAKNDEYELVEIIANLKVHGLFSKTIRDGIRLINDLRGGSLEVLFELFPWVRAEFLEYVASTQPQKSDTETIIQKQLARIEELLANGETTTLSKLENRGGGPKPLKVPAVADTTSDDGDVQLTVKKIKTDGNQSAENFLSSAFSLQG